MPQNYLIKAIIKSNEKNIKQPTIIITLFFSELQQVNTSKNLNSFLVNIKKKRAEIVVLSPKSASYSTDVLGREAAQTQVRFSAAGHAINTLPGLNSQNDGVMGARKRAIKFV